MSNDKVEKYIINHSVFGFNRIEITDDLSNIQNSIVTIILNEDVNSGDYYNAIKKLVKSNRVILISSNEENAMFKAIASYMVSLSCYDIYTVESINDINIDYMEYIVNRESDFDEVQSYLSGDISSINRLDDILFGIENTVANGSVDELKEFVESNLKAIDNLHSAVDYLKKSADLMSSNELDKRIKQLKDDLKLKDDELNDAIEKLNNLKRDKDSSDSVVEQYKNAIDSMSKELESMRNDKSNTEVNNISSVKSYSELKVSLLRTCNTRTILYVKEVSYVTYTNTLMTVLMTMINKRGLKAKMVIYDNSTQLYQVYGSDITNEANSSAVAVINAKEYTTNKAQYMKEGQTFVLTEPIPNVLEDILTSTKKFDVVIVYDRMKCATDIVTGNNVVKLIVANSRGDYNKVKDALKISTSNLVLTRKDCDLGSGINVIDIPTLPDYKGGSESAKAAKYSRVKTESKGVLLLGTLMNYMRIKD